ncbi:MULTISPECIES: NUDIX hydrolase [unclassified Sporosarcina]|uniref:NUDIX hydrolase n=1 Tax=unclassified Sporosarcina TaxID=2647733 RepID=UPI00315AE4F6
MGMNYCSNCGEVLEIRVINDEEYKACSSCSFIHWGNYSVSVGALVIKDEKMLLVRRKDNPGKGKWTNPGGYIGQTELIEQSVIREVLEETGVTTKVKSIVMLGDYPGRVHNIYIGFLMEYLEGQPQPDEVEVDGAGFFSLEEMESMNVADMTRGLVRIAFDHQTIGLKLNPLPKTEFNGYTFFNV